MDSNNYLEHLGIGRKVQIQYELNVEGAMKWGISKAPAVLGGKLADWAYRTTLERFKDSTWVPETLGTVGVVVVAFGLQVVLPHVLSNKEATRRGKVILENTQLFDKITDGMFGRMSPSIMNTVMRLMGIKPKTPANSDLSLDGDDESTRQIAARIGASPDFLDSLADGMVDVMQRDDVDIDAGAKPALVKSMREVARQMGQQ